MSILVCPAGATLFLTVALADRGSDLLVREVEALREAVRAARAERPFQIEAWVTLPDHFHAVWTLPEGDMGYSKRIAAIKARFARTVQAQDWAAPVRGSDMMGPVRARGGAGATNLWESRFQERHLRDEAEVVDHVRLCWNDPVRHRLVGDAFDWPHSSIHRDMAQRLRRGAALRDGWDRPEPSGPLHATQMPPTGKAPPTGLPPAAPLG